MVRHARDGASARRQGDGRDHPRDEEQRRDARPAARAGIIGATVAISMQGAPSE